jgi:hypothetical protein
MNSKDVGKFQKKPGPGRFYLRSGRGIKLVKSGEVISCLPGELGKHLKEFDRLDPAPPPPKQVACLRMEPTLKGDGYNVYQVFTDKTSSDRPINDVPLTKEQAESMLEPGGEVETSSKVKVADDSKDDADGDNGNKADQADENNSPTGIETMIDDLCDVPPNTLAVLKKAGYVTVSDINKLSDEELLDIPGVADKSLIAIRDACGKVVDAGSKGA